MLPKACEERCVGNFRKVAYVRGLPVFIFCHKRRDRNMIRNYFLHIELQKDTLTLCMGDFEVFERIDFDSLF